MFLILLAYAVGMTTVFTRGTIFASTRGLFPALFNCALCIGTWVGFLIRIAYLSVNPDSGFFGTGPWSGLDVLAFGALAGTCSLVAKLLIDSVDTLAAMLDKFYEKL